MIIAAQQYMVALRLNNEEKKNHNNCNNCHFAYYYRILPA